MGTGIAFVSAVRAKVPVLRDSCFPYSPKTPRKLKGQLTQAEAAEAKIHIRVLDTLTTLRDVNRVVEEVSEQVDLKKTLSQALKETLNEDTIWLPIRRRLVSRLQGRSRRRG